MHILFAPSHLKLWLKALIHLADYISVESFHLLRCINCFISHSGEILLEIQRGGGKRDTKIEKRQLLKVCGFLFCSCMMSTPPHDFSLSLSTDTGSEERAQPSSESDTSSATPAESSLLLVPCPGRSHATSQPRTSSTIQREALSPGKTPAPPCRHALHRLSLFPLFCLVFSALSLFSADAECTCAVPF